MSELRQDRTTGVWVIIAPERGRRPQRRSESARDRHHTLSFDPAYPFCPGNKSMLPSLIEETPVDKSPGWQVRVVPNKYPVSRPEATTTQALQCSTRRPSRSFSLTNVLADLRGTVALGSKTARWTICRQDAA